MILDKNETARCSGDDLQTLFYDVLCPPTQIRRDAVGRSIPGGAADFLEYGAVDPKEGYWLCIRVEGMGDHIAVCRTQAAHEDLLHKFGCAQDCEMLRYQLPLPGGHTW